MKKQIQYVLESKFFTLGEKPITKQQLEWYCKYWWPIQFEFTLGLVVLLGNLSKKIRFSIINSDFKKEDLWKSIFQSQAPSIVDEMGLGRDPYGLMHHDLFIEQVCHNTTLTRESLLRNPIKLDSNLELANEIAASMTVSNEIGNSLCMMYLVEMIAPQLFTVQKKIFLAAGSDIQLLRHSMLHESLEKEHASESMAIEDFLSLLILNKEVKENSVKENIIIYSKAWKRFLDTAYEHMS